MTDGVTGEFRPERIEDAAVSLRAGGGGTAGVASLSGTRPELLDALAAGDAASIHSWELVTSVDGPGTRMTVFFSGCPLRCQYCHNPDTMFAAKGETVAFDDLFGRLKRYRGVFRATGGGLTVTGGEPLQQPRFVERLLRAASEVGIHTCLDTSGFLGRNAADALLDHLDLCLLDLKAGTPELYREVTGAELAPTLEFGRRLVEHGVEIWVRFVLVPDLTDAPDNVAAVADLAASFETVSRVEVLPFHQMGRDKWATLGLSYRLAETRTPTPDEVDAARAIFRSRGLTTY